ncbi:MAG: MATE family efflux transporter [Tannerella sp.]|jgi:putative MATE family efflux protein|nr:MATE family efflux transporter [Tannerella sp.]
MPQQENSPLILGTERIGKLLKNYAIPGIIAMTASSLYNIADSIFIGQGVGPLAISGLALTFPFMNLAAAFGTLVGVGASTVVSVKLGQKDYEGANKALGNVVVLNLIIGLCFTFASLSFLDPILRFFGAGDATLPYAHSYMKVILFGNAVTHMYFGLNAVMRSSGHPRKAMYATLLSVFINIILNPLFIFGLGWGIKGSALATVISQCISLGWLLFHFSNPKELLHFKKGIYTLKAEYAKPILAIGLSPFLMNLCACLVVLLINRGLKEYGGDLAIGAYGLVNRIIFLFLMVVMGLNQGMQPIAGYNFGALHYHRVTEVTKLTIVWATGVCTLGYIVCNLFPTHIIHAFTRDAELTSAAVYGMHIAFGVFPTVGFQMVSSNFFMSIGMPKQAILLSLTRQLLFLIPGLLILPSLLGIAGVWLSLPVSDSAAFLLALFLFIRQIRKFKKAEAAQGQKP